MTSATICTLVEGDFHLGLGVLVNSLTYHGYQGVIWVGFRGGLPPWAAAAREVAHGWELQTSANVTLRFLPLDVTVHLTNYKATFLREVWERWNPEAERLFYFDPDIVIKVRWSFFEEWVGYGAAMVEDVNSPVSSSHPRRGAWRNCLQQRGQSIRRELSEYINGGFLGLFAKHREFLEDWEDAMRLVGEQIGGLENSMFSFGDTGAERKSDAYPFSKTDQDALNIAVMTTRQPISIMGPEGMDFRAGGWTMAHALGPEKPWRKCYWRAALQGRVPSLADREFWRHADGPLNVYSAAWTRWKRLDLGAAAAIGRFYHRV